MATQGFYKWTTEGDAAGGSVSNDAPSSPNTSFDPEKLSEAQTRALDLDIEKKRLQLVGVDPEKFDYFFDKYYDRVFEYAYWSTADHDQAADVAGEVFARAWERRRQFRWQGYSFGAWLFQIARSVISHQHRHHNVRQETAYVPAEHDGVDHETPADVLDAKSDQELVRLCLEKLTARQYEAIVMQQFMGMTARQIALVTETAEGTVHNHLRRGKKAMRRCLTEHGAANGLSEAAQRIVRQAAIEDSGLNVVEESNEE